MIGKLNSKQIEELLKNQIVGRIGCHTGDHMYVVPVSYAYDGKCVYVRLFEGKKIERNCFQNPVEGKDRAF